MSDPTIEAQEIAHLRNVVAWLLKEWERPDQLFDFKKKDVALIVIDMQKFVCEPSPGQTLSDDMVQTIDNINVLVDYCRREAIPVIWVRENMTITDTQNDAGLIAVIRKKGLMKKCNKGPDTEIYEAMHYDPAGDQVGFKTRYSAFIEGSSNLADALAGLGLTQLIFTGVLSNVCWNPLSGTRCSSIMNWSSFRMPRPHLIQL